MRSHSPHELKETDEISLSRDEDNVTCLAVGQTRGKTLLIYAGVNSSIKDQEIGKNEHLRVFGLEVQDSDKSQILTTDKISELSRLKFFTGGGKDTYQRVLRLSPPFLNSSQIGAVATGLASESSEVVLFDTTASPSATPNIYGRALLTEEAADVDVLQTGEKEFLFAYCTRHDIFVKTISPKEGDGDPLCITPGQMERERGSKSSFRSIRFLSPEFILLITNIDGRGGVLLQTLRLPTEKDSRASIARQLRLPSKIRQASGLAVCNLTTRSSPSSKQGYTQFVIAVAGQDISISLFTVDYQREGTVCVINDITPFQSLKEVHPMQMTGLAFSVINPRNELTPYPSIKLASVSVGNTVIVHTIPLKTVPRSSRHIVAGSGSQSRVFLGIFLSITALIIAIIIQSMLEIRGHTPEYFGLSKYVPPKIQSWVKPATMVSSDDYTATPSILSNENFKHSSFSSSLDSLISRRAKTTAADDSRPIIIIREQDSSLQDNPEFKSNLRADLHDVTVHGPHGGKTWEQLTNKQRQEWKKKLKAAGYRAEDFAETVTKGIVFGEIAGVIGAAVGG